MDFGLVVDLETTGIDCEKDEIIEIGLLQFAVSGSDLPSIVSMYSGLEDPGVELSAEITKITGISNSMLSNQKIDWQTVTRMFSESSVVIAHNAAFDASFLKRRNELTGVNTHWACSASHINWKKHGYGTRALNYLAADHGFLNPFAHRALFDCATTFRLIAPHLQELIARSYERVFLVAAVGSPFETKDMLRNQGYRWDPEKRLWQKVVLACDLEEERQFLAEKVYKGGTRHVETEIEQPFA